MTGFQTQVNVRPAPAVEGDFASANPRHVYLAGPGGLVAGVSGLTIGRFAWVDNSSIDWDGAPRLVNNYGAGPVAGFIHREMQGLITTYLAESGMIEPMGFECTVYDRGDFWVKNNGATPAVPGQKVYAKLSDGTARAGATGSPTSGGGATGSIAATTGSFTGSIAGNVMTISAVGSGVVVIGGKLSGTNVISGTRVVSQLSGTPGGVGTYVVSIGEQSVASTTISETYGTFTAASALTGAFAVGDLLSGTNVVAGTYITAPGTGTGGLGTYIVSDNTVVGSTTISATSDVETSWAVYSEALVGELMKISNNGMG